MSFNPCRAHILNQERHFLGISFEIFFFPILNYGTIVLLYLFLIQAYAVFAILKIWKDIEGYWDFSLNPLSEDYTSELLLLKPNFQARSAFSHGFFDIDRV